MTKDTKFAVAIHILTMLATRKYELTTSQQVARSVNTNPVVVRRLLAQLAKAGLVEAKEGKFGGSRIARPPEKITLLDVLSAIAPGPLFNLPEKKEHKACRVSCGMKDVLPPVLKAAEQSLGQALRRTKISDLLAGI
jgi:Rrf2 family protein